MMIRARGYPMVNFAGGGLSLWRAEIMCNKIYGVIVLLAAIVLAAVVVNISIDNIDSVMKVMKFFDVMIPVLAVGALIKYVFCGSKKCYCKGKCGKCGSENCKCGTENKSV